MLLRVGVDDVSSLFLLAVFDGPRAGRTRMISGWRVAGDLDGKRAHGRSFRSHFRK